MISIPMGNVPMGTIVAFVLNLGTDGKGKPMPPPGWLMCDHSPIPQKYSLLISYLNSHHTPNLTGRTLIGTGVPDSTTPQTDHRNPNFAPSNHWHLGNTGGEYQHTLTTEEIPSHDHTIHSGQFGNLGTALQTASSGYIPYCMNDVFGPNGTDSTGGGGPHPNMQPYYAVHYIIYTGQPS
jgi:microcystin-dependent protein